MGRVFDTIHRITFVIDEDGKIAGVINPVKSGDHAQQILTALDLGLEVDG